MIATFNLSLNLKGNHPTSLVLKNIEILAYAEGDGAGAEKGTLESQECSVLEWVVVEDWDGTKRRVPKTYKGSIGICEGEIGLCVPYECSRVVRPWEIN